MKHYKKLLWFRTAKRTEILNITAEVVDVVGKSGVREGFALVYPMHTSSAVYISDSDPSLTEDFEAVLARLIPQGAGYRHDTADPKENADAHLRAVLAGHHVTLPVSEGRPDLGTYQTIYYAEFDGMRDKEIQVKVLGE